MKHNCSSTHNGMVNTSVTSKQSYSHELAPANWEALRRLRQHWEGVEWNVVGREHGAPRWSLPSGGLPASVQMWGAELFGTHCQHSSASPAYLPAKPIAPPASCGCLYALCPPISVSTHIWAYTFKTNFLLKRPYFIQWAIFTTHNMDPAQKVYRSTIL